MAITREQFVAIVGNFRVRTESGLAVLWCREDDGSGFIYDAIYVGDKRVDVTTPFRLRCLLYGLGIKCDWDEPVSFERLMAIDGATTWDAMPNAHVSFGVPEVDGLLVEFSMRISGDWFGSLGAGFDQPMPTMRQVHLLLAAAGVGNE